MMTPESFKTRIFRYGINLYPMFFGTGGKVLYIAGDWTYIKLRLKLGLWTRNYVGTIFGGSQFAVTDPMYMVMLFNILGPEFVVWDKAGAIQFKKPGLGKLHCEFSYTQEEIALIKATARADGKYEFKKETQWIDAGGEVVSIVEKSIYVATKEYYRARQEQRKLAAK